MSNIDEEVRDLMPRLLEGTQEAIEAFILLYTPVLKRWVRSELQRHRAPENRWFDVPSDLVQEVWAKFFQCRYERRPWESVQHLASFLRGMVNNVTRQTLRDRLDCQKRDANREQSIEEAMRTGDAALLYAVATPLDEAIALELLHRMLKSVPAAKQVILELLRQGYGTGEVASITGLSERTIRRVCAHARGDEVGDYQALIAATRS